MLLPASDWGNQIVTGLLVEHNQDGTHAKVNGNTVPSGTDTVALLAASQTFTNKTLTSPTINQFNTASGLGAAWQSWTPTLTNMSTGNGTLLAKYAQIGKTVHFTFRLTFGSTSTMGTSPKFSLPTTVHADAVETVNHTSVALDSSASTQYFIYAKLADTNTTLNMFYFRSDGVPLSLSNITSAAPMTWATGDYLEVNGTYEAA